jgi:general stress protein 26
MITKKDVLQWIHEQPVATLATVSFAGMPQLATVYTYIDEKYLCYLVTKQDTRKYENLKHSKAVSLSWFDAAELVTCEISGEAYVVHSSEEVASAIARLQELVLKQKSGYWIPPVGQMSGSDYVVLRVTPELVRYVDYSLTAELDPQPKFLEFLP